MMKAIFSGVHMEAATNRSPSFSRSSSSATTTISPRPKAAATSSTWHWDSRVVIKNSRPVFHLPLEVGGRPASAGREGVTALQHSLHMGRRCHPTPDCLWQSDPPPSGEGGQMTLAVDTLIGSPLCPLERPSRAFAHLPAVTQIVIGEHARHHGLADRDRPDADAGVVAAPGCDFGFAAIAVEGTSRRQDRRGRLDGEPRHDRLAGGDAAQDAAGVVGEKTRLAVIAHAHLVGVLL